MSIGRLRREKETHLVDEDVEDLSEPGSVVDSVDDVSLVLVVDLALRPELDSEELGRVCTSKDRDEKSVLENKKDDVKRFGTYRQQVGQAPLRCRPCWE